MRYLSVCSGIEAASVAWHPLGWQPSAFSEIDKFPCAVLAHHYPTVPNWGDMTRFQEWPDADVGILVGGTPCQSFSVAGLRKGLDDPRGNLMLTYGAVAKRYRPDWLVWENVPGVLSSNGGRDFGTFLGMLAELGYGFAYRVLDAQYIRVESHARAVPQRRRRVFVVGCLGDWRRAAAVLFERESLQGHPAPRREAGQVATGPIMARTTAGGGFGGEFEAAGGLVPETSNAICARDYKGARPEADQGAPLVTHSLTQRYDSSEDGCGRGTPIIAIQERAVSENPDNGPDGAGVRDDGAAYTLEARTQVQAIAFSQKDHGADAGEIASTLRAMPHDGSHANGGGQVAVAFSGQMSTPQVDFGITQTLGAKNPMAVATTMAVRRLTPRECERLQGFPDDYTLIPYRGKSAADGPRYKALGNSMAVNVMSWIGQRIQLASEIAIDTQGVA